MIGWITKSVTLGITAALVFGFAASTSAQQRGPAQEITKIKDNIYQFRNRFHNAVFAVTPDGVILVDSINKEAAEWPLQVLSAAGFPAGPWNFIQVVSVALNSNGNVLLLHRGAEPIYDRAALRLVPVAVIQFGHHPVFVEQIAGYTLAAQRGNGAQYCLQHLPVLLQPFRSQSDG